MITLRDWTYATPLAVAGPEDDCLFYHWMDLPSIPSATGIRTVPGFWDLRGRIHDYLGGVDPSGKSVLDVGTATGWVSFEVERLGAAEIVGLDIAVDVPRQFVPYFHSARRDGPGADPATRILSWTTDMPRGYWYCHRMLNSAAKVVYGDVNKVGDHISGAEIVIVGQILVHQRDPLEALLQCARVAEETLVIVEGSFESDRPVMAFCGADGNDYSWFHLSTRLYVDYLGILGFEVISMTRNLYRCTYPGVSPAMEVWTIVAKRVGPTYGGRRRA